MFFFLQYTVTSEGRRYLTIVKYAMMIDCLFIRMLFDCFCQRASYTRTRFLYCPLFLLFTACLRRVHLTFASVRTISSRKNENGIAFYCDFRSK